MVLRAFQGISGGLRCQVITVAFQWISEGSKRSQGFQEVAECFQIISQGFRGCQGASECIQKRFGGLRAINGVFHSNSQVVSRGVWELSGS